MSIKGNICYNMKSYIVKFTSTAKTVKINNSIDDLDRTLKNKIYSIYYFNKNN